MKAGYTGGGAAELRLVMSWYLLKLGDWYMEVHYTVIVTLKNI